LRSGLCARRNPSPKPITAGVMGFGAHAGRGARGERIAGAPQPILHESIRDRGLRRTGSAA
jgi:hypothetical protein